MWNRIIRLAGPEGFFRARDLAPEGIHRSRLRGCEPYVRGVYSMRTFPVPRVVLALYRTPHAIAALTSALYLHGLLPDEPRPMWVAISRDARKPCTPELPVQALRWSRPPEADDVTVVRVGRFDARTFTLARTAVDFIRFARRFGPGAFAFADFLRTEVGDDRLLDCARRNRAETPVRRFLASPPPWAQPPSSVANDHS